MKYGFIGFGEAAFCICSGLRERGVSADIAAFDAMQDTRPLIRQRARETNVALLPSAAELAQWADVILVIVQPNFDLEVYEGIRDVLRPGQLCADLSASSPTVKQQIWALLEPREVLFADAAMMGLLISCRDQVPIRVSGNGARAFCDAVTPLGMKAAVVGEAPGAASGMKLLRSIYMKGHDALLFEMMRAAEKYGIYDEIIQSVGTSLDPLSISQQVDLVFPGVGIHAARRAAELKGTIAMLEEAGIDATMSKAIQHQLELIAGLNLDEVNQGSWDIGANWRELYHRINEMTAGDAAPAEPAQK